jgi:serine/threonine protein kinase
VHRDVKPSNVLVAPDGPQVIDFGVARVAERVQLTATRGAAGTPAYMAPEQARDATLTSPASDVFSLGATLVFAATGHPPYRGDTVMDILVRLATEPPDLTGVPDELAALLTACLDRTPRNRPTEAAILAELGTFAHGADSGHSYLPDSAMALIAEYQRNPRFPAESTNVGDDEDEDSVSGGTDGSAFLHPGDATSGSHTALPGFESPAVLQPEPGSPGSPEPPGRRAARRRAGPRGRSLLWAGAAVAALLAGGISGFALRGPAAKPTTGSRVNITSSNGANSHPSPPTGKAPCTTALNSAAPYICVNQPWGDGHTVYVIHGNGYVPFSPISIRLVGPGISRVSADGPQADQAGTFNYGIDQGHYFFPGQIPPGKYHVIVNAPGRSQLTISFLVYKVDLHPPADTGPPPNPPPSGGPPPSG